MPIPRGGEARNASCTRRRFLARTGASAAGLPFVIARSSLAAASRPAPSDRITMGAIGLGIRGTRNMRTFMEIGDVRVLAICDVFGSQRQKAKAIVDHHNGDKDCAAYIDFRDLIARDDIEAVSIAAPDHWHVLMGLAAARAGKDMYFEKPLGVSLEQAQALRAAVKKHKIIFQFGTQQRSSAQFRFVCELVRNKKIGALRKMYVGAPASWAIPDQPPMPVPEDLAYDMWLGPAPKVPYTYQRCRPHNSKEGYSTWYHIYDYCLGFIANWGIHHLDIAQWGNGTDETTPIAVTGTGVFPTKGIANCCTRWALEFTYANGVTMIYTDNRGKSKQGVRFEGTEGWAHVNRAGMDAEPKSLLKEEIGSDDIRLPRSPGHYRNFIQCVRSRRQPICPVDVAVHSDTICQLADIATRTGRALKWDPAGERFVGDEGANQRLSRPMRAPWRLG